MYQLSWRCVNRDVIGTVWSESHGGGISYIAGAGATLSAAPADVSYIRPLVWKYSSYRCTKSFCATGVWQARHLVKSSTSGLLEASYAA